MRTVVRSCLSSRATAMQTPRIMTLKQHHMTFISTVPRRVCVPDEEARNGDDQAGDVEEKHDQKRLRDPGIEEGALDHAALGGDVELAQPGVDERHHGGQQNVGRQHGLVDLIPEGMPMLALNARVGDVGER